MRCSTTSKLRVQGSQRSKQTDVVSVYATPKDTVNETLTPTLMLRDNLTWQRGSWQVEDLLCLNHICSACLQRKAEKTYTSSYSNVVVNKQTSFAYGLKSGCRIKGKVLLQHDWSQRHSMASEKKTGTILKCKCIKKNKQHWLNTTKYTFHNICFCSSFCFESCTWLSWLRSLKPSRIFLYFLSLYFLRMNVARCSSEAPLWSSSSRGRLAAQKLLAFLFPTSRKNWGVKQCGEADKYRWESSEEQLAVLKINISKGPKQQTVCPCYNTCWLLLLDGGVKHQNNSISVKFIHRIRLS